MGSQVIVDIHISTDEYQKSYAGVARDVLCFARDGRKVRFPAHILRGFVTHHGISGSFVIRFGKDNKFQGIDRLVS